jgi:hypothetical protein
MSRKAAPSSARCGTASNSCRCQGVRSARKLNIQEGRTKPAFSYIVEDMPPPGRGRITDGLVKRFRQMRLIGEPKLRGDFG